MGQVPRGGGLPRAWRQGQLGNVKGSACGGAISTTCGGEIRRGQIWPTSSDVDCDLVAQVQSGSANMRYFTGYVTLTSILRPRQGTVLAHEVRMQRMRASSIARFSLGCTRPMWWTVRSRCTCSSLRISAKLSAARPRTRTARTDSSWYHHVCAGTHSLEEMGSQSVEQAARLVERRAVFGD
jgi:hypothetical protein